MAPRPTGAGPFKDSWVRTSTALVSVFVLIATLSSCGRGNTVSDQARAGDGKGYVAGDGAVEIIQPPDRRTQISISGRTLEGAASDTDDYLGMVVVINTWGSWCPPCNAEAPVLERTWQQFKADGVRFVGVDVREGPAAGMAFQRKFNITYPSLRWDGGGSILRLKGKASATPATLVVDRQGRLAGRISGATSGNTLRDIVQDVLDESSAQRQDRP